LVCGFAENLTMENCPMAVVFSADEDLRRVIMAGLGELGCTTYDGSQADALAYAAERPIDVVVVDAGRFDAIESESIRKHLKNQPQLHILYLLEAGDVETEKGIGAAYDAALRKPFDLGELCDIVSTWLAYRATLERVTNLTIH
jgi:DNA-binding response OmpR family regulator